MTEPDQPHGQQPQQLFNLVDGVILEQKLMLVRIFVILHTSSIIINVIRQALIMKQIIINIKDQSKLAFLMQLINQLDFVEVETIKKKKSSKDYNFFDSAGMWSNKQVNAKELRKQVWNKGTKW